MLAPADVWLHSMLQSSVLSKGFGGAAGWVTRGHPILSTRVMSAFVMWVTSLVNTHGYRVPYAKPKNHFGRATSLKPSLATILAHQNCLTVMMASFCGRNNEVHQSIWWVQAPPDDSAPLLIDYLQCMQEGFHPLRPWSVCLGLLGH